MPRHIKQKQSDDGIIIDPSHKSTPGYEAHLEKKKRAIQSSPDLSKLIPVRIPELKCTIFMKPGEDADAKVSHYKERLKFTANTAKKKNGEFLTVEE